MKSRKQIFALVIFALVIFALNSSSVFAQATEKGYWAVVILRSCLETQKTDKSAEQIVNYQLLILN